jgi:hypothetical protein
MTPNDLRQHFGFQVAISRAVGISEQAVSRWFRRDRVPLGRQYEIQILTGGKLRADPAHAVSRDDF